MKNRNAFRGLISILLIFLIVMGLSCSFNSDEGNGSATMSNTVIIGKVGRPFYSQSMTVTLKNASFKVNDSATINNATWVSNIPSGIGVDVSFNDRSQTATFTFKPNPNSDLNYLPSSASMDNIIIDIPSVCLYNQLSNIRIEGPARFNIASESDRYGYLSSLSPDSVGLITATTDGKQVATLTMSGSQEVTVDYVINLEGEGTYFAHDFEPGDDVTNWFAPLIQGVSFSVKNYIDAKSTSMVVTGRIKPFNTLVGYTQNVGLVIPQGHVTGGELLVNSNGLAVRSNNGFQFEYEGDANKIVSGTVGTAIEPFEILLRSPGSISAFTALDAGTDVSSWFGGSAVDGISYTLKDALTTTANVYYITVSVSGTPTQNKFAPATLTIPAGTVKNSVVTAGLQVPYTVDLKGMKYEIAKKDGYVAYEIYDLASYGNTELSMGSINASYTKKADGSELGLSADNNHMITSGETATAVIEGGLSRYGYELAGFNKKCDNGAVSTDVLNLDYTVGKEVKIDATTGNITITIKDSDKGQKVKLYAIWKVDEEAWGWTKNSDGSYEKTQDISKGGTLFPAVFDVSKAYPGDENAELRRYFDNYPYYKEAKVIAKGLKAPYTTGDYNDSTDVELTTDFAIGEQVITGYMVDVLREWNAGDPENGIASKGYEIPSEITSGTSLPSGVTATSAANAVSYGSGTTGDSDLFALGDKSAPITYVSFTQGMVLSNAFTAYYNEMNKNTEGFVALTPAYVDASGEIKTIDAANTYAASITTSGASIYDSNSTGFRLPTSAEWGLAARIVPENDYPTNLTGAHVSESVSTSRNYTYPQITRSNMWSGGDTLYVGTATFVQLADKYAWYSRNSGDYGLNQNKRTHGFLKIANSALLNKPGTVLDKAPNNIGVYGMSGNVWEWTDTALGSSYRRLRGGSFDGVASNARVGYLGSYSPSLRVGIIGLRLARSV